MQAAPDTGGEPIPTPADRPPEPPRPGRQLPTPRVASLAVMAMLAFGVVAGSLSGPGGVEALAKTFVVSLAPPAATTPGAPVADSGGNGGGGGGGGSQETITETVTEPAAATTSATTTSSDTTSSSTTGSGAGSGSAAVSLPPIKHVFLIMLSSQGYDQSFGTSTGHPYLATTLRKQGELLEDYYGVAPSPLANEIALISGQGPTQDTAADCPVFASLASTGNQGSQALGNGCCIRRRPSPCPTS